MGRKRRKSWPKVWTNTHWLIQNSDFNLQPNLYSVIKFRADGRGLTNVKHDTILTVISEPVDPVMIKYDKGDQRIANFDFVEVLYQGQIWYTYCHRIVASCQQLK